MFDPSLFELQRNDLTQQGDILQIDGEWLIRTEGDLVLRLTGSRSGQILRTGDAPCLVLKKRAGFSIRLDSLQSASAISTIRDHMPTAAYSDEGLILLGYENGEFKQSFFLDGSVSDAKPKITMKGWHLFVDKLNGEELQVF